MARYVDRFNEDSELDLSGLHCPNPRCGSPSVRIIKLPNAAKWMGRIGSALCEDCGTQFSIREIPEDQD